VIQIKWVPARPEPPSNQLLSNVDSAYQRADKAFSRRTGRSPREVTVYVNAQQRFVGLFLA
jgi:hypothetical protein